MNNKALRVLTLLALITLSTTLMAQKQFTLEDLNFGGTNYKNMTPGDRTLLWWGDRLVHVEASACYTVNPSNGKESPLLTAADLNRSIEAAGGDETATLQGAVSFPYPDQPLALVTGTKAYTLYNFKTRRVECRIAKTGNEQAVAWNAKSRLLACVTGDNLYVGGKQLTTDGSRDIVYGQSVHRNEWGIDGGLFWSPDGKLLAYYRMDQSMVTDYPEVNIPEVDDSTHRIATPAPEKYPMAGQASHKVTILVYNTASGRSVQLQAGDPTDRYFTNVAWSPDSKTIYVFELNRDQNDCRLVSYDATTGGKIAELYRETDPKYVEPLHPIVFLPWNADQFILQSQKDGYNHLYLMDKSGHEIKQLTSGKWVVEQLVGFNPQHQSVIIASNELNPLQRNLFAVDLNTGRRTLLGSDTGWHTPALSASGRYLVDKYQAPDVPRHIDIVNVDNGRKLAYYNAPDPWAGYTVPTYECGTIKAADGVTPLYYRMVKPAHFDPAKKYPTVVYVYGGPHAHNVDAGWHWRSRSWETYMAQRGYVLFILDNRGSENRGRDFEQATYRQLGQEEMKDQMKGVEFLRTLPYVDTTRLGVHGWSFGGFMTISLMTNYPDVFKVGVAGGPVIDWKWYEVMYGERYMDTPQSNPEGYAKTSLLPKAKDLKGKLQIIIGYNDPTVVPQHALTFLKACIEAGTQPDFFTYPGQGHNMRGHQSVHLHERITQYFDDYLKPLK
ncbi:MAG: DPP IV N-terminal domain-containing protein [Sodaliphilus pleomorphus]|uniref:S9 family peptidase n=1 Tax=Sodaliphilus pleomorphus TaxID=2606626 RepID=UPI002A756A9F|nr:DPP IV N-terminal domain-containing protein [Sodaliphilus pleomorphus]MDY2833272.1 DPP IV N-terminal domain-containing protein [Sodaliphilus pleomorphus]